MIAAIVRAIFGLEGAMVVLAGADVLLTVLTVALGPVAPRFHTDAVSLFLCIGRRMVLAVALIAGVIPIEIAALHRAGVFRAELPFCQPFGRAVIIATLFPVKMLRTVHAVGALPVRAFFDRAPIFRHIPFPNAKDNTHNHHAKSQSTE
jgi:hypothetical protein